jgi:ABC-type transporter Mla subunit MlaD
MAGMKTPKLLGDIEHTAARQLTLLLRAGRKQYDRFMNSAEKVTDRAAQRRYIRAAEQTIDSAEKIIAQLRKRISAAQRSLMGGGAKKKRKVKKRKVKTKTMAKRAVKRTVKKAARKGMARKKGRQAPKQSRK